MINEEQRARRRGGIFSSDVPRCLDGQAIEVYLEKRGEREPPDIGELEYVQLGNLLESAGLDAFALRVGGDKAKRLVRSPDTIMHRDWKWLGAHCDGLLDRQPVEVKAVGVYNRRLWGEPGSDQVPNRVMWQVQAQMAVLAANVAVVPVVFATEENLTRFIVSHEVEIEVYQVMRSERLIEAIYDRCGEVWGCVEAGIPPKEARAQDAAMLYDYDKGTLIQANPAILDTYQTLCTLQAGARRLDEKIEEYRARLQSFMKNHAELRWEGNTLASWRRNKDSEILDGELVRKTDPALWAKCLKTKKGPRVFKVNEGGLDASVAEQYEQMKVTEKAVKQLEKQA